MFPDPHETPTLGLPSSHGRPWPRWLRGVQPLRTALDSRGAGPDCLSNERCLDSMVARWWSQDIRLLFWAAGIQFPRVGWRRGIFLVGVYAPTSDSTRQDVRDKVPQLLQLAQATSITCVLGDLNAELGNNVDPQEPGCEVLGSFASPRVTVAGSEWRVWAVRENLKECASRFSLRHRCTWRHPRFQSEHELDHAFILESCLWHLTKCRILKEGPSVQGPWSPYTDHNPVEVVLRHGKVWTPRGRTSQAPAREIRNAWVAAVEQRLANLGHGLGTRRT